MAEDRDYVLGTHETELARLGLQHDVWRPVVLDCWRRAGIRSSSKIVDVGAGPGYATVDLAEIVGPAGEVTALERSHKFVEAIHERCRARALNNVRIHELDLMIDNLPDGPFDFSWCRWVLSFVSDPGLLVRKIAKALRKSGVAIFHEAKPVRGAGGCCGVASVDRETGLQRRRQSAHPADSQKAHVISRGKA